MKTISVRSYNGLAKDTFVTDEDGKQIENIKGLRLYLEPGSYWTAELEVYTGESIEVRTSKPGWIETKNVLLNKVTAGGENTELPDEAAKAQKEAASRIWGADPPKSALEWVRLRWAAMWKKPREMKMQCAVFVQADEAEVMASELERYALEIRERKYYQGSIGGRGLCGVYSYGPTDEEKESKEGLIEEDDEYASENVIEIALTEEGLREKAFGLMGKHAEAVDIAYRARKFGATRIAQLAEQVQEKLYERLKSVDGCIREVQQHNDEKS